MLRNLPWCSWTPPSRYPSQHWRFVVACPPRSCDLAMPLFQQDMLTVNSVPSQGSTNAWCDASRHTAQDASAHQAVQHKPVAGHPFYSCSTQDITDIVAEAGEGALALLLVRMASHCSAAQCTCATSSNCGDAFQHAGLPHTADPMVSLLQTNALSHQD